MSHSASLQTLSRSSSFSSSVDDESSTPEGDLIDQLMEKVFFPFFFFCFLDTYSNCY